MPSPRNCCTHTSCYLCTGYYGDSFRAPILKSKSAATRLLLLLLYLETCLLVVTLFDTLMPTMQELSKPWRKRNFRVGKNIQAFERRACRALPIPHLGLATAFMLDNGPRPATKPRTGHVAQSGHQNDPTMSLARLRALERRTPALFKLTTDLARIFSGPPPYPLGVGS